MAQSSSRTRARAPQGDRLPPHGLLSRVLCPQPWCCARCSTTDRSRSCPGGPRGCPASRSAQLLAVLGQTWGLLEAFRATDPQKGSPKSPRCHGQGAAAARCRQGTEAERGTGRSQDWRCRDPCEHHHGSRGALGARRSPRGSVQPPVSWRWIQGRRRAQRVRSGRCCSAASLCPREMTANSAPEDTIPRQEGEQGPKSQGEALGGAAGSSVFTCALGCSWNNSDLSLSWLGNCSFVCPPPLALICAKLPWLSSNSFNY